MAKVRVYELAKELGIESKELLQILSDMGEFVRSASSTVQAPAVRRLKQRAVEMGRAAKRPPSRGMGVQTRIASAADTSSSPPAKSLSSGKARGHVAERPPRAPTIAVDLVLALHPVEIDAVELTHPDHPGFRLRIDKLEDDNKPYWLSVWISEQSLPMPGPWKCLQKWRLPLRPLKVPEQQLPGLGVLQFAQEKAAGEAAQVIASRLLGEDAAVVKLSAEECSQSEANRRYGIAVLVHRRHGHGGRKRFVETTCLKCGLPLSDPTSVKIGIGPACRRQMGRDAIRALSVPQGSSRRVILGARASKAWVTLVKHRFRGFREQASALPERLK